MWWNSMSTFQQVVFIIACAATVVLIVQIILMFVGADHGGELDVDADVSDIGGAGELSDASEMSGASDIGLDLDADADVPSGGISDASGDGDVTTGNTPFGFRLLSVRSILAFFAVGSWVCYTVCYALDWYYALLIAIGCGFAAACAMAGAMIGMEKLQSSGNMNIKNAVGKIGSVYLTIPASRGGKGKVNVLVQERYAEYDAVTDCSDPIPTATEIKVIGYVENNVLLVERYKKPSITVETI